MSREREYAFKRYVKSSFDFNTDESWFNAGWNAAKDEQLKDLVKAREENNRLRAECRTQAATLHVLRMVQDKEKTNGI